MAIHIPTQLTETCRGSAESQAWLEQLPDTIRTIQEAWSLALDVPFDTGEGSCAWVAPVIRGDGTRAVLKLGMPHMEAKHEIQGLRFWNGDAAARLLEADEERNAMLLERCEPGIILRQLPEPEQDIVIAGLLRRLWRVPPAPHPFRPLAIMTEYWANETRENPANWSDIGLVQAGLDLFAELPRTAPANVLLATDLHAGNVLQAQREPWLAIDPKPFIGDPAYDATQHLLNCRERLQMAPHETIRRFADLLEIEYERTRLWTFARLAAESYNLADPENIAIARMLAK